MIMSSILHLRGLDKHGCLRLRKRIDIRRGALQEGRLEVSLVSDGSWSSPSSAAHELGGTLEALGALKKNKYINISSFGLVT